MSLHSIRIPTPADDAAEALWDEHADNLRRVRRVSLDPDASDRQRRRAIEIAARSEVAFKRAFLAREQITI